VNFIGLGRMGLSMARSLRRARFPLTVYNRTRRRVLLLGDTGTAVAESPAEVASVALAPGAITPSPQEAGQ